MQTSWSNALALAPFVLGVVACSGADGGPVDASASRDASDVAADAGPTGTDAATPPRDGGEASMDAGEAPRDAGEAPRDGGTPPRDAGQQNCSYPAGAVEPMALDQVLTAYSWPVAYDMSGPTAIDLDLTPAFCNTDDDIEWSPFDLLLFVSVPAW